MKKLKCFIILAFPLLLALSPSSIEAQAIDWDSPGATWIYKMVTISEYHYYKLKVDGDTIIGGQNAKKIQVTQFFVFGSGTNLVQGPETYVTTVLQRCNRAYPV